MPAVLIAMCTPSRSDQAPTKAATSHCREFGASPATGHNAAPAPTKPTENVQMVSTQPELPVCCCTTQAPIIKIESEAAMATSAPKYEIACMTVQPLVLITASLINRLCCRSFAENTRQARNWFHGQVP